MGDVRSVRLDDEELEDFLGKGGTGVASFLREANEPPYSLPVSYGYEPGDGHFIFRLAFSPDTKKREVVDDGVPVSFVTYDEEESGWESVVATGELEEVSGESLQSEFGDELRQIEIPLVDVYERDPREVTFRFFRLDPDEITGRKETREY